MAEGKRVSIIIIALNEEKNLQACLESIKRLDYPKKLIELLVVDGGSTDRTLDVARKFGARIIRSMKGFAVQRNAGLKNARNGIIVFTDADCIVPENWLNELMKHIDKYSVVGGPTKPPETNIFGYMVSAMGYPAGGIRRILEKAGETKDLSTCSLALRKEVVKKIGLFSERFVFGGEDTDFIIRAGKNFRLFFNPKAFVYHKPRDNLPDFIKWWLRRGKADIEFHKKYMKSYPFSLLSPKHSVLLKSLFAVIVLGLAYYFNALLFGLLSGLLVLFIAYRIIGMQKDLRKIKQALPVNAFWFWTLYPLLVFLKGILRELGRIKGFIALKGNAFKV